MEALEAKKIRYILIGMSAAVAQGVMANTLDIDLWIELPSRQYMRVINLSQKLGATPAAKTVVYLEDGVPVNFVYDVTGLGVFASEWKHTVSTLLHGHKVPVLKLERILKSKEAIRRDKDELHILHIREFLKLRKRSKA